MWTVFKEDDLKKLIERIGVYESEGWEVKQITSICSYLGNFHHHVFLKRSESKDS